MENLVTDRNTTLYNEKKMKHNKSIITNLEQHIQQLQQTPMAWETEWRDCVSIDQSFSKNHFSCATNHSKLNRYSDVLANDDTRVKLAHYKHDYINANYINASQLFENTRTDYIATQGPTENTIADFWYMVKQQSVSLIVMLAQIMESGRPKCAQYWPKLSQTFTFQNNDEELTVTTVKETIVPNSDDTIIHRQLKLRMNNNEAEEVLIDHLQYVGWPDHGVPKTTKHFRLLCELCEDIRSQHNNTNSPVAVHCSAGIGRTGTLMTVSIITEQMRHHMQQTPNEPFEFQVLDTVKKLKQCRKGCVQMMSQYQFCYSAVLAEAKSLGIHMDDQENPVVTKNSNQCNGM
jgi:protein tyrosine phosphatase